MFVSFSDQIRWKISDNSRDRHLTGCLEFGMALLRPESVAGASAGVVGTVLGFPLDTIKTRMQFHGLPMTSTIQNIYKEGGYFGFYRGILSPLVALTVLNTLNFSSYAYFRSQLGLHGDLIAVGSQHGKFFEAKVALAGGAAGPFAALVSTPFELVKTQMQLRLSDTSRSVEGYTNSIQTAVTIIKKHGFAALYRAHTVNTFREVLFLGTYFTVYEHLKSFQIDSMAAPHSSFTIPRALAIPLAGGLSGAVGWFVSFPLDCIKSTLQGRSILSSSSEGDGAWAVARHLMRTKGVQGLYSGITPSILRAFIVSSSRFSVYEVTLWLISTISSDGEGDFS